MLFFKSKGQKEINKLYKALDTNYRELDRLREDLHRNKQENNLADFIRKEIKNKEDEIKRIKKQIIKLEK